MGGLRPKTSGQATASVKGMGMGGMEGLSLTSSAEEAVQTPEAAVKKESGGLRRKLSLGWRRSSSKAASHAENKEKGSPLQPPGPMELGGGYGEKPSSAKLQKRASEMPPPRLPASASAQWSSEGGLLGSTSARPSLEGGRRRSNMPVQQQNGEVEQMQGGAKTRALHSEQPQPVPQQPAAATRSSSWAASTFGSSGKNAAQQQAQGPIGKPSVVPARHKLTASTISAIVKDKDDLAADDEMRRLSQKRKDVDAAARETEALKLRAVARTPVTPSRVLQDRNAALNIYERGEIVDYEKDGVFFTGAKGAKKVIGALTPSPTK